MSHNVSDRDAVQGEDVVAEFAASADAELFPVYEGVRRWHYNYDNGCRLDALGLNKESDVLIVSFHGALNRSSYTIPRFERLKTLSSLPVNSLYFGDPTLYLDPSIQLGWYVGWPDSFIFNAMARQISSVASKTNATKVVLTGSSGGGYAALQVGSFLPDSLAVVFNPQTHIHGYHDDGQETSHGAERKFIEVAYPAAAPNGIWSIDFSIDWTATLGDEYSAVRRYATLRHNRVIYANNLNDWHVKQHFEPFYKAASDAGNEQRIVEHAYRGQTGHHPPTPHQFLEALSEAIPEIDLFSR